MVKAAFPLEELSDAMADAVKDELLDAVMNTADEELADIVANTVTGGLSKVVTNAIEEGLLGVVTDTVERGFLGVTTGMVAGAMVLTHSEARKPARLCLKSSKSFLVIFIQSMIGEPWASQ